MRIIGIKLMANKKISLLSLKFNLNFNFFKIKNKITKNGIKIPNCLIKKIDG